MFILRRLGGASLDGPDGPVPGRAGLRQRVALLAVLAVEHPRPVSRDKIVANLWPESGTDDGRHQLRDTLYILRSALGDDSVLSTGDDLRLNPARLTCDLWEFDAALLRDDPAAAVGVYHGPLLSGFHLPEAEEFEPWAEGKRALLARRYVKALEQLAEREMQGGDPVRAVEWWARLAAEDPYNSRIAMRYMQALEAAGDRAGALRHASVHSELLRTDLDAVPEGEVVALAERLRLESRAGTRAPAAPAPAPDPSWNPGVELPAPLAEAPSRPSRRRWVIATALLGVAQRSPSDVLTTWTLASTSGVPLGPSTRPPMAAPVTPCAESGAATQPIVAPSHSITRQGRAAAFWSLARRSGTYGLHRRGVC